MSSKLLLTLAGFAAAGSLSAQTLLTSFTFETLPPPDLTAGTYPNFPADTGVGTGSGVHAAATTNWTTPAGNGSGNSFAASNWAVGDYFQFTLSTVGSTNIFATFGMTRSGTGPTNFYHAHGIYLSGDDLDGDNPPAEQRIHG